ncbi:MAG: YdcH family protein [Acidobacteria bacterium]|nr:YdcH family protein [Acidobacteriota bacterium]
MIERDSEFKMLFVKHQELEDKLQELLRRRPKTEEERIAEKTIKKEKLRLKDAMQKRISSYPKPQG